MGEGEAVYGPMISSQSCGEPMSWTVNFLGTFQSPSSFRWDGMARLAWSWVFAFSQIN